MKIGNQTDLNVAKLSEYTVKSCVSLHEYTETSIFKRTEDSLESATDSPSQHVLCSREYVS